jgi:hypothetical protein
MHAEFEEFNLGFNRFAYSRSVAGDKKVHRDERGSGQLLFWAAIPSAGKPVSDNVVMKRNNIFENKLLLYS